MKIEKCGRERTLDVTLEYTAVDPLDTVKIHHGEATLLVQPSLRSSGSNELYIQALKGKFEGNTTNTAILLKGNTPKFRIQDKSSGLIWPSFTFSTKIEAQEFLHSIRRHLNSSVIWENLIVIEERQC